MRVFFLYLYTFKGHVMLLSSHIFFMFCVLNEKKTKKKASGFDQQ